ncbi:MAG: hypothetical protein IPP51_03390 [Bacteroidetes bacterium]|nr:hypothetical protein [Bacteroidota bacterium]
MSHQYSALISKHQCSLCRGAELHLNAYGATTYQWSGPGSFNSTSQLVVIPNVQTSDAGTYTVVGSNPGGCTASSSLSVAISSNHAPQLNFSGTQTFANHLVIPQAGEPSDRFRFQVTYSDADGELPASGYPRLMLDFEGNQSYLDANDQVLIMHEVNINDQNVSDGKDYYYEIIGLEPSIYYTTTIVADDSSGCETTLGSLTEPQVRRGVDLTIFANDITFSNTNPNPGSTLSVTAKVHNYTGSSAQNFTVHLKNQFSPGTIYPDQVIPYLGPYQDILITWNITTPANPAWCPMQVFVDYTNAIAEPNELDNQAIRPFQNGHYTLPGDIYLTASPVSDSGAACTSTTIVGSAYYRNTAITLPDSSCAGATVSCTIVETGMIATGYTNSHGDYSITFETVGGPGLYHVNVSVTDYTLDGDSTTQFTLVYCPLGSGGGNSGQINDPDIGGYCYTIRDLAPHQLHLQGSLQQENTVPAGDSLLGGVQITNFGCDSVTRPSIVHIVLPDGNPVPGPFVVPPLAPGEGFFIDLGYMVFPYPGNTYISITCDYTDSIQENSEFNNTIIANILVLPPIPDIDPIGSNVTGDSSKLKCELPELSYQINNEGPVSTGSFNSRLRIYRNGVLESTQIKNISNILPQGTTDLTYTLSLVDTGLYTFSIDCDFQNTISEISELNNNKTDTIHILPCKADLTILSCGGIFVQPADPNPGDTMRVSTNIYNAGQTTAYGPFVVAFSVNGIHYSTTVSDSIQTYTQK